MTDAKIEGDVSAEVLQTFEGSNIKGNINSSNTIVCVSVKKYWASNCLPNFSCHLEGRGAHGQSSP